MSLTLPYPPSLNAYLRTTRQGRIYKTEEAKAYQMKVKLLALTAGIRPIEKDEVCVMLSVFRPQRRGDLDNSLKVLLDALNGVAYTDDGQIGELIVARFEDPANPRVTLTVSRR